MRFKVKFFGTKERKGQLQQVKMEIETYSREAVEDVLHNRYGYCKVNGLKVTELES